MKRIVLLIAISMAWVGTKAQSARDFARQGNQAYQAGEYEKAAALYHKADSLDPNFFESAFNKGDAYYQQGNFDEAIKEFNEVAQASDNTKLKAQALHNLGNAFLEKKEYDKSVDAFKNALRTDPTDEDTRYNLSYAMKKLQEQQKKEQEQKDQDQDKDQEKDNKDQDKQEDKDQKDDQDKKDKQDQDKKDKDQEEQNKDNEKKNQDEQKKDENKSGEDQQQPSQPKEGELSKKDAQRMLKANENQEKKTQEKMRKKLLKGEPKKIEKNW